MVESEMKDVNDIIHNVLTERYFITMVKERKNNLNNMFHCIGFYSDFNVARNVVVNNICDIHEQTYEYCVIESFGEGIYETSTNEVWFEWINSKKCYVECEKPKSFMSTKNFAIC